MAEEEKTNADAGISIIHDVGASAFLTLAMEIQDLQ